MLQDLDTTLGNVLADPAAPSHLVAAEVSFATPDKNYAPQQGDTALNLFLYEVRENRELRDPTPLRQRLGNTSLQRRPPVRVDCAYLVTAWSATQTKIADEHELLGLAFAWLSRFPVIPATYLPGSLADQPYPPPSLLAQWDAAKNFGEFWSALGIAPRPFFNLIVTIAMDLERAWEDAIVTTISTHYHADDPAGEERIIIGGTVRDKSGIPVPDAWVRLEPSGMTEVSSASGQFVFPDVARGSGMTLRARAPGHGEASRPDVEIPSLSGDYDLQFH